MTDDLTRPKSHRVPPGTRLNGIYEIEHLIADGGMGEVYKGHNIQTNDPVAIKLILPELSGNPDALGLFRREASTLHNLFHEAIVRYFVFSVDPDLERAYLAMEFVDGPSLADMIKAQGPLDLMSVRRLQRRVADGLDTAHLFGVVHRDISPDNIILPGGEVRRAKIIDFGIARSTKPGAGTIIGGGFAGKYNYVSPEQLGLAGGDVTGKSDIYSLGLVLAEAMIGAPIDMSGTQFQVIEKRRTVPDLSAVPDEMRPLIEAMLQPLPEDRPASMADVAEYGAEFMVDEDWRRDGTIRQRRPLTTPPAYRGPESRPPTSAFPSAAPEVRAPAEPRPAAGAAEPTRVSRPPAARGPASTPPEAATVVAPRKPPTQPPAQSTAPSTAQSSGDLPPLVPNPPVPARAMPARPGVQRAPRRSGGVVTAMAVLVVGGITGVQISGIADPVGSIATTLGIGPARQAGGESAEVPPLGPVSPPLETPPPVTPPAAPPVATTPPEAPGTPPAPPPVVVPPVAAPPAPSEPVTPETAAPAAPALPPPSAPSEAPESAPIAPETATETAPETATAPAEPPAETAQTDPAAPVAPLPPMRPSAAERAAAEGRPAETPEDAPGAPDDVATATAEQPPVPVQPAPPAPLDVPPPVATPPVDEPPVIIAAPPPVPLDIPPPVTTPPVEEPPVIVAAPPAPLDIPPPVATPPVDEPPVIVTTPAPAPLDISPPVATPPVDDPPVIVAAPPPAPLDIPPPVATPPVDEPPVIVTAPPPAPLDIPPPVVSPSVTEPPVITQAPEPEPEAVPVPVPVPAPVIVAQPTVEVPPPSLTPPPVSQLELENPGIAALNETPPAAPPPLFEPAAPEVTPETPPEWAPPPLPPLTAPAPPPLTAPTPPPIAAPAPPPIVAPAPPPVVETPPVVATPPVVTPPPVVVSPPITLPPAQPPAQVPAETEMAALPPEDPRPPPPDNRAPKAAIEMLKLRPARVDTEFIATLPPFEDGDDRTGLVIAVEGKLPAGLAFADLGSGLGVIRGKPVAAGDFSFDVIATDPWGAAGRMTVRLTVEASDGWLFDIEPAN
ncbi:serine/threonine-protein kinase [Methylobrevis albus]|uniref:serine/threonine-protein kinase n=1 Tax=Methylobrevis albus TaxID=2793297 RepID=UPI001F1E9913|nr:serine/threonine-protein kinase [Methylobrevis albus]